MPEEYISELGIRITSLSPEEKLFVLPITYSLKSPLPRHSGHWLFGLSKLIVPFASTLPYPCPHAFNFCVLWNSVLSPVLSHSTAFPRESRYLQLLQLSASSSLADASRGHPFSSTPTLTFRLIFLTIRCILSLEIRQVPQTQHVDIIVAPMYTPNTPN